MNVNAKSLIKRFILQEENGRQLGKIQILFSSWPMLYIGEDIITYCRLETWGTLGAKQALELTADFNSMA